MENNKVSVSEKLNAIVNGELKELRDTMDYLDAHRIYFDNTGDDLAPVLNLKTDDGSNAYACWAIRIVEWDDATDEVKLCGHIFDTDFYPDLDGNNGNCYWMNCDDDKFRERLIPGEITELTKRIGEVKYVERKNETAEESKSEKKPVKVWVLTHEEAVDGGSCDTMVFAYATKKEAMDELHACVYADDGELAFAQKRGWVIDQNTPEWFNAYEDGSYSINHTELTITECTILK